MRKKKLQYRYGTVGKGTTNWDSQELPLPHFRAGIYVEAQIIELDLRPGPVEFSDESNFAERGVGSQRQMRKFCKGN